MDEATHTPGPWETYGATGVWARRNGREKASPVAAASNPNPTRGVIEHMEVHGGDVGFREACANARLMATSPEMLDSLREVRDAIGMSGAEAAAMVDGEDVTVTLTASEVRTIYALVAKAEGREV